MELPTGAHLQQLGGCPDPHLHQRRQVERYDKHGRLYQVREPSGTDDAMITTTYSYDVACTISAIGGQRFS